MPRTIDRIRLRGGTAALIAGALAIGYAAAPGGAAEGCANATADVAGLSAKQLQAAVVCEFNLRRAAKGLKNLKVEKHLTASTRAYAKLMDRRNTLDHYIDNTKPSTRARKAHYKGWRHTYYEDIAQGFTTARSVVDAWMSDAPHRKPILGKQRDVGVGYSGGYWAADWGNR